MLPILIIKTGTTVDKARQQYGDFEDWIIEAMERPDGEFQVVDAEAGESLPDYGRIAGAIITGSPAMVTDRLEWSEKVAAYLQGLKDLAIPTLGICYGHQLLAHAFGGTVANHPGGREIGTTQVTLSPAAETDTLLQGFEEQFDVHTSHLQSVTALPADAQILASNDFEPHHAVRFAENVWGLQFHPEFDEGVMRAYIEERDASLSKENLDPARLLQAVRETPVAKSVLLAFSRLLPA